MSGLRRIVPGARWLAERGIFVRWTEHSVSWLRPWEGGVAAGKRSYSKPGWRRCRPFDLNLADADYAEPDPVRSAQRLGPVDISTPERLRAELARKRPPTPAAWRQRRELARALRSIPRRVRTLIRAASDERHFHLLAGVKAGARPAEELLADNPALLFMLSSSWVFRRAAGLRPVARPLRSLRARLRGSRVDALRWLGWENPTKGLERILRRANLHAGSERGPGARRYRGATLMLLRLRRFLADQKARHTAAALPKITGPVAYCLHPQTLPFLGNLFLEQLAIRGAEGWDAVRDVQDILAMAHAARGGRMAGFMLRDFPAAGRLHHELVEALRDKEVADIPLPEFPLRDLATPALRAELLKTSRAVAALGRELKNCLGHGGWIERCLRGRGAAALLKVEAGGERGAAFLLDHRDALEVVDYRWACNAAPSPEAAAALAQALREASGRRVIMPREFGGPA